MAHETEVRWLKLAQEAVRANETRFPFLSFLFHLAHEQLAMIIINNKPHNNQIANSTSIKDLEKVLTGNDVV